MSAETVARNARCPCGSGHRYKDCCGSLSARVAGQTLSLPPFLDTELPEPRLADGKGWIETEQHASQLEELNERGICPPRDFTERVRFIAQDMNAISRELRDFDFVWSSCAFEHLGSLQKGGDFVLNAMQCLTPGGLAIHTTEFNLSSNVNTVESPDLSVYRKRDMEELRRRLAAASYELPALNLNPGSTALDRHVDLPPYRSEPHLRLLLGNFVLTSIGLIARRGCAG